MGIATVNQAGAIGAIGATLMAGYKLTENKKGAAYPALLGFVSVLIIFLFINSYDLNIKNLAVTQNHIPVFFAMMASFSLVISIVWSIWRTHKIDNTLNEVMIETAKTTSMVFIILLGAAMLTAAFRGFGGEEYVKDFLQSLPGGFWSQFIVVMAVIFILGFFLDFIEIAVVVVPIIAPILLADPSANITAVWLGVMIGVNIQTSFLTPPFGFALFYLRGVASKAISTISMYKGVVPFIILQLIALVIVGTFPPLVNYLPNRFYLSSFNAPPPMNPKLEYCVEEYLSETLINNKQTIQSSINNLSSIEISILPKNLITKISESIESANTVFEKLDNVNSTKLILDEATLAYQDIHFEVRTIQRDIKKIDGHLKRLKRELQITDEQNKKDDINEEIKLSLYEKESLSKLIPTEWEEVSKEYQNKLKALSNNQRKYRRAMDDTYDGIEETIEIISSGSDFVNFKIDFNKLKNSIDNLDNQTKQEAIKEASKKLSSVPGGNSVKSLLNKARKEFKKENFEKANSYLQQTEEKLNEEIFWRELAVKTILPELKKFQEETSKNIGLRGQERLPSFLVPRISRCRSVHQDISLNF